MQDEMKTHEWHPYVLMMAKHKCLEKMEALDKEDTEDLSNDDFHVYKDCAKAIYYIMSIEKAMKEQH